VSSNHNIVFGGSHTLARTRRRTHKLRTRTKYTSVATPPFRYTSTRIAASCTHHGICFQSLGIRETYHQRVRVPKGGQPKWARERGHVAEGASRGQQQQQLAAVAAPAAEDSAFRELAAAAEAAAVAAAAAAAATVVTAARI